MRKSSWIALGGLLFGVTSCALTTDLWHGDDTSEGRGMGRYENPEGSPSRRGQWYDWVGFYARRVGTEVAGLRPVASDGHVLAPAVVQSGLAGLNGKDGLTWLGHATFLIRLGGTTVLTDPFLSDYATPIPPFGPKRYVPPGLTVAALPPIDVLVVSHNHYDHLDAPTVEALPGKDRITVLVPSGLGDFFRERGYTRVRELGWHDRETVGGLAVTALPALHNSGRSAWDKDETLWAGYLLSSGKQTVYFSGDTGFGPLFEDLGARYDPPDYALVPIGGYEPAVLMDAVHTNPEEAVSLARAIGAKAVVGMHWGTVNLTDEPFNEPPRRFRAAARSAGYADEKVWLLRIGESRPLR